MDNTSRPSFQMMFCYVQIDYFVKIYPGVRHGWTVRYNAQDEAACKPADEAQQGIVGVVHQAC